MYSSLELTEKLESNPEEVLGVAKLSKAITIAAFQTKGVHCLSKAKKLWHESQCHS